MFSYFTHLECPRCHTSLPGDEPQGPCACGSPLLARYDLTALQEHLDPDAFAAREASLWRYHELLPAVPPTRS